MRITHKKTIDRQATGAAQKRLDDARAFAAKEMQELRERRKAVGAKPGEGRVGGWHRDAVFNAVEQYGPEVLSGDAQGFWDDMKRLYPESCADDRVSGTDSINGHGCKFGRVSKKFVGGRGYVWKGGKWVAEGKNVSRRDAEAQRGGKSK